MWRLNRLTYLHSHSHCSTNGVGHRIGSGSGSGSSIRSLSTAMVTLTRPPCLVSQQKQLFIAKSYGARYGAGYGARDSARDSARDVARPAHRFGGAFFSSSAKREEEDDDNNNNNKNKNNNNNSDDNNDDKDYLIKHYKTMVKNGKASKDQYQITALMQLDKLRNQLLSSTFYTRPSSSGPSGPSGSYLGDEEDTQTTSFPNVMNTFSNLFSSTISSISSISSTTSSTSTSHPNFKGVYLHGGVGCGKTFCMNLFYDSLGTSNDDNNVNNVNVSKQKVHFHSFMLNVHKQMHEAKMVEKIKGDVVPHIIKKIIQNGNIICFDEFQVTDVADALLLRRLFTGLLDEGCSIIITSNRQPSDLYLNGLQRDLFLPFIDLLYDRMDVVSMWESDVDYRLVQGENKARGVYFIGSKGKGKGKGKGDEDDKTEFDVAFDKLTKGGSITPTTLTTQGRIIHVPKSCVKYNIARFSFDDLCRQARGAADYLIIGNEFHTVFIEDVPALTMNDVNLVRRFIIFVDSMYECHVKLIIHAETCIEDIFKVDLENEFCDEVFAFDRTRSRLEEMGSDDYLKQRWVGGSSD